MKLYQKIFFFTLCGGCFFMSFSQVTAFLGEDLGLDMYKVIDEGFYELEQKQYEYELKGQGETEINEVIKPILGRDGIECDIQSADDLERLIGNSGQSQVQGIIERCTKDDQPIPTKLIEQVIISLEHVKNTYKARATDKAKRSYDIARIGLYSDGDIENSGFDLIYDLEEIDRIIFSEAIEYEGEPYENADDTLDDFLNEDKDYLYEDLEDDNKDKEKDSEDDEKDDDETGTGTTDFDITSGVHNYICAPDDSENGLDLTELGDILDGIEGTNSGTGTKYTPTYWVYPEENTFNEIIWGGPFVGAVPDGTYEEEKDTWECNEFFCITIEFQKTTYGLAGGETVAIDKILEKALKHLEKPANVSLTQRKQTTNNFELGSIINNLADTLRGANPEVSSKPIPIKDLEGKNDDLIQGDYTELENLICIQYKNAGLDCERANDLANFSSIPEEQKIVQTQAGMPIDYAEHRKNELRRYQQAQLESNRVVSQSIEKKISSDDIDRFDSQFAELEVFVGAMEDFVEALGGIVKTMKKIPTRSS